METLKSARLLLRSFAASDASRVQQLASDPEVALRTANIPYPYPIGGALAWIEAQARALTESSTNTWAVCRIAEQDLIGAIELVLAPSRFEGAVGYWIGRPFWNQGYASEALKLVLDFGFSSLKLQTIAAQFVDRNKASGRVMEKCGLKAVPELSRTALVRGKMEHLEVRRIAAVDHQRSQ
ncbi:MAG: GNAT family N-acetyltransferase [Oligoflexia bacterium]|nr:GNAT family N-acetyltransferase [Oligoflexia bacterium]